MSGGAGLVTATSHGDRDSARVALTFDDGPAASTADVLDALAQRGARATFFVLGELAQRYPDLLGRVAESSHEIGNHGMRHERVGRRPLRTYAQLRAAGAAIEAACGRKPRLFRPPWGGAGPLTLGVARLAGLRTVLWDVNSLDWQDPGPEAIVRRAGEQSSAGSIVLLHDGIHARPATVAALPALIDLLRAKGLELVTVSELLADRS